MLTQFVERVFVMGLLMVLYAVDKRVVIISMNELMRVDTRMSEVGRRQ